MVRPVEKIVEEIHVLSSTEKEELMQALVAELDTTVDAVVDAAWLEEAQRRGREIDDGAARCIPAAEVFERLTSLLKK